MEMSQDKKQGEESIPDLHPSADSNDVDFVEVLCPAKDGRDPKIVPEIEIKLESSDEEEDRSEEGSTCSAPPQKRKNLSGASSTTQEKGYFADNSILSMMLPPPRKRKSTSEVWQFFCRDPTNICRAICGLCKMSVSRGKLGGNFGTTALKRHLECKHPLEWAQRNSMRLQRTEVEEEEEETFEDEEEKDEAYQNMATGIPTCPPSAQHSAQKRLQAKDGFFNSSQGPSSPKTYEIIDSSDEEEERAQHIQGQPEEGSESKRTKSNSIGDHANTSFTMDTGDFPCTSHELERVQPSSSLHFNIRDYSAVPLGARRRKSISAVWQFFCLDRTNICRAICNLCQTSVSRGKLGGHFGTSALMRHLEGKHPLEWGRGKFNKMTMISSIEVEDDEDDDIDESIMYPEIPFSSFGQTDIPLYSNMQNAISQMQYNMPMEYNTESGEASMDSNNVSLPISLPSFKGEILTPTNLKKKPSGRYPPNHPKAQAWNQNITELICEMALPYSFISSKAFHKFMSKADLQYSVPTKSFFSKKAVPQVYEAVCKNIASELKRSTCPYIHITAHMWSDGLTAYYLSLTAHWSIVSPDADQPSERKYAVLCIKHFPKEFSEVAIQQELIRQANLWLTSNGLSPGFFISNRDFNLVQAIKSANCTYIPCFTHSINLLVQDFLQNNRYIVGMLSVARNVCNHFIHSARARRILAELQYQNNLPKQSLKLETISHWTSTFYMLQRLLEQQKAVQAYFLMHKVDTVDIPLNPSHWNLMLSLVDLLQPFEMATREVNSNSSCLSQVLPELRYLHIFLKKIRGHFEIAGDANGVIIADSLALKLSTDYGVNEMFQKEEYVLATLLDPRFKGRIEAILPPDSDIDHWKQVLVKKVKDVMSSSNSLYSSPQGSRTSCQFRDNGNSEQELFSGKLANLEAGRPSSRRNMAASPLIHKDKTLIEHLESVGLLASKSTGASLSTESHSACVMVDKYLQDNKTISAKDDPLVYWQKRTWLWPALTKLAIMYLTCPSSSIFSERVFSSSQTFMDKRGSSDVMEGMEHMVFLKSNLQNFPNYNSPPLIFSDNEAEQSDSDEGF